MCEYRTGYPVEREDGVVFVDPDSKGFMKEITEDTVICMFEADNEPIDYYEPETSLLTGGV